MQFRALVSNPGSEGAARKAARVITVSEASRRDIIELLHAPAGKAIVLAGMLAVLVGLIEIGLGIAKLGFVADLLSKPTILGYIDRKSVV